MKTDSVGEMVANSFFISGSFSLVLWMLGLFSGFTAVVIVLGLTISPMLDHLLTPR